MTDTEAKNTCEAAGFKVGDRIRVPRRKPVGTYDTGVVERFGAWGDSAELIVCPDPGSWVGVSKVAIALTCPGLERVA